jgi:choline monooxygenase
MFEITNIERSTSLPSTCYTDSTWWNVDMEKILPHTWQYVGPSHNVKESGHVLATNLLGKPVIIVRQDQTLRAFYNVCRHRGGPLVTQSGHYKRLQCQYHGWTYALDGTLVGSPHMQLATDFDKSQCPLKSLQVKEWNDLLFLTDKNPMLEFTSLIEGIDARIAPLALGQLHFAKRVEYPVSCNWKIYIDNYLEGYHVPFVHPELNKVLQFADYTTELSAHYSLQHSPLNSSETNPYSRSGGHAYYYFLFPNIMLNILPGRLQVNSVVPETPNSCRVIFDYFYDTQDKDLLAEKFGQDTDFSDLVQRQDIAICETLQKNMQSGVYESGRLSPKFEQALHHFQNFLKAQYIKHLQEI